MSEQHDADEGTALRGLGRTHRGVGAILAYLQRAIETERLQRRRQASA